MTSAILSKLSKIYPQVLTNPESVLGSNAPKVLEFWIYVDTLSKRDKTKISDRYWVLDAVVRGSSMNTAWNTAKEVVGWEFRRAAWNAACDVTGWRVVFGNATLDLIGNAEDKVAYNLIMSHKKSSWFRSLTKFLTSWYS